MESANPILSNGSDKASGTPGGAIPVIPVGKACSSFPVNFAFLNHGEMQFVAFYDENRRMTIGARGIGDVQWVFSRPEGRWLARRNRSASSTDYDSHNYLAMAVDGEGYLHLSGNMHGDPLVYFRSTKPLDVSSFVAMESMVGSKEESVTYPVFCNGPHGEFIFRYREGGSGNGSDYYNVYNVKEKSWSRLLQVPLLDGGGERNAYAQFPKIGPDGWWHMVWMWREHWDCVTNNNLSYAKSPDLVRWYRADGTALELPIRREAGEIVDPVPVGGGLLNMVQEVGFDHSGRPVLTYHKYDKKGHSQACAARWENGRWIRYALSDWDFRWDFKGGGSIVRELDLSCVMPAGEGKLEVHYASKCGGAGVWVLNEATMEVVETKPPARSALLESLLIPSQGLHPDAQVHMMRAEGDASPDGSEYILRWETLPANRDQAPAADILPTQLEVMKVGANALGMGWRI